MTVTLDATPSGTSANSYGTLAEAEDYFAARPGADAWLGTNGSPTPDDPTKTAALIAATVRLEQESYAGYRSVYSQALLWPRYDIVRDGVLIPGSEIPIFVKRAQFEEALALLADPSRFDHDILTQFESLKIGPFAANPRPDNGVTDDLTPASQRLLADVRLGGDGTFRIVVA
jgi:hypothetical protein